MNFRSIRRLVAFGAAVVGASLPSTPAAACGGLFCSQAAAVNQSAERIIFSNDGNGTVTAVIQIMYEGPSENFSWLLPIAAVPDEEGEIAVASDIAFQRLQAATNPQYNLTTDIEGTCRPEPPADFAPSATSDVAISPGSAAEGAGGGVTVAASGVVGSFEWTALAFDPALDDPAGAGIAWLTENGYDVLPMTAELIRPYLESGLYLLALKLTKGSPTGAIRPIVLSYPGDLPSIPIKLTAVAANDDMGVMTWMLSGARAVPFNYADLELNEARINWFNASANYDAVVTAAADDAGGQGFVTEFAGRTQALSQVVWPSFEEEQWNQFRALASYADAESIFNQTAAAYSGYDGFWEVVRANVQLPDGVTIEDVQNCAFCYFGVELNIEQYFDALEAGVIEPMRLVQRLIDEQPYVTRLYSTLSAAEMTVDPVFTYNRDLRDVNNIHTARRVIECEPHLYQWEANWRVELPQGGVVRGTANDVGSWPGAVDAQPANVRIRTLSESGPGRVMQDNSGVIGTMLQAYNATVPDEVRGSLPNAPTNGGVGMGSGRIYSGSRGGCGLAPAIARSAPAFAPSLGLSVLAGLLLARRRRRS